MPRKKISITEVERLYTTTKKRTQGERIIDTCAHAFGTPLFLGLNFFLFATWILINTLPSLKPIAFDPYPFSFLTVLVSLEAIFLSVIVLMSQNREMRAATRREELDLRVNIRAEKEVQELFAVLTRVERKVEKALEDRVSTRS